MYSCSTPSSRPNDQTMRFSVYSTCRFKTAIKQPTPHNTNAETEALKHSAHLRTMLFEVFPAKLAAVKAATRVWGSSETQQHCNPLAIGKKKSFQTISLDSMLSDPTQWYFYRFCLDPLASGVVPKLPYMLLYFHTVGGSFTRLTNHHSN